MKTETKFQKVVYSSKDFVIVDLSRDYRYFTWQFVSSSVLPSVYEILEHQNTVLFLSVPCHI
jgi:hypothetical protein